MVQALDLTFSHASRKYASFIFSSGMQVHPLNQDQRYIYLQASIPGPPGSPYEGGLFFLHIRFTKLYPCFGPEVRFTTKIFHPNVSLHGEIGIDLLGYKWSSGIRTKRKCQSRTPCSQGLLSKVSAADVKMVILLLVRSLKSSILSSTSFQLDDTFWEFVSAAAERSRWEANMVALGQGKFGPKADPKIPPSKIGLRSFHFSPSAKNALGLIYNIK